MWVFKVQIYEKESLIIFKQNIKNDFFFVSMTFQKSWQKMRNWNVERGAMLESVLYVLLHSNPLALGICDHLFQLDFIQTFVQVASGSCFSWFLTNIPWKCLVIFVNNKMLYLFDGSQLFVMLCSLSSKLFFSAERTKLNFPAFLPVQPPAVTIKRSLKSRCEKKAG